MAKKYIISIRKGYERARFEFDDKDMALDFLVLANEHYVADKEDAITQDTEFLYYVKEEQSASIIDI